MDAASALLLDGGPLLTLAFVILAGISAGALSQRIGLPGITGQILVGVLVGRAGLDLVSDEALHGLEPLTDLALGLIAATVGAHLNLDRLRNAGRRLSALFFFESLVTPIVVFAAIATFTSASATLALLLGTVAIATAPATIVALVRETRAKGVFVKTLVAAVALNNMACIALFEVARVVGLQWMPGADPALQHNAHWTAVGELGIPMTLGALVALALDQYCRHTRKSERVATGAVVALVFTSGLATALDVSPLLACLVLGVVQTNVAEVRSHLVDSVFAEFEPAILAIFFTLAGMHLSTEHLAVAGWVAVVYFAARIGGKWLAADLAMRVAGATDRVRRNLGLALVPQAGVAVGLVLVIQRDPAYAELSGLFTAVVLTVVTVNEIVGPLLTRFALGRAGEIDRDRVRLIDFLQEEHIVTGFHADSKQDAIEKLVDLMIRSHGLRTLSRDELLKSVLDREAQASTCLGGGLSVPHGILPSGFTMTGVMALSQAGLPFETPDGRPVHCMVLLGTAPEQRDRHLQVLATLARTVGIDPDMQSALFAARSPAHAYELLHGDETEDFNYFLEEDGAAGQAGR
jgi:Kef-type K+ transport system membrane component KefB/mannitol/fructose-specific phosphotransferase system IIA component (Ntr-type)